MIMAYLAARCRCDGGYDTQSAALAGDAFDMSLIFCPVFLHVNEIHDGYSSRLRLSSTSLMVLVVCTAVSSLDHSLITKPQSALPLALIQLPLFFFLFLLSFKL